MRRSHKNPDRWLAPCRDIACRRGVVVVTPTDDRHVALVLPPGEVAVLDILGIGRLRAALRDAGLALDGPKTAQEPRHAVITVGAGS